MIQRLYQKKLSLIPRVIIFFIIVILYLLIPTPQIYSSNPLSSDDFDDNTINNALWDEVILGTGLSVSESNQKLEISIPANSANDPSKQEFISGYLSSCKLKGDFDIQVDYSLPIWPAQNGVRVGLVTAINQIQNPVDIVERVSFGAPIDFPGYPREVYLTQFVDGVQGITSTNDLEGKLRLIRNGGSINGLRYGPTGWISIHSALSSGIDINFGLFAWSTDAIFTNQDVSVAFDNFIINQGQLVCGDVGVPYFSQVDDDWKDSQYDSLAATIGQVGCTISAATMILNHFGFDSLPDGSPLNVGTLNDWLNQNSDGDWRNGLTSWTALTRLTNILHASDSAVPILTYKKISPPDFELIDQILTEEKQPLIFEEQQPDSPSGVHFTAATGVITSAEAYAILDPFEASRSSMVLPPDSLISARYLSPAVEVTATKVSALNSVANLSYLILHADHQLNTLITNPDSQRLGKNKSGDEFREIPESLFDLGYPLAFDDDHSQTTGDVFWEYTLPGPMTGEYQIEFTAANSGWYSFELLAYDRDANPKVFKHTDVFVDSVYPTRYRLDYVQDGGEDFAVLDKIVDFDILKHDVEAMRRLGLIQRKSVANLLRLVVDRADRYHPDKPRLTNHYLRLFEHFLNRYHPRAIDDRAYGFLGEELEILRSSI